MGTKQKGFTLLEVVIAVAIMAFLSMYTAEAIQKAVQSKVKIQKKLDKESALFDTLAIMSSDIQKAFHFRDFNTEAFNQAQKARQARDSASSNKTQNSNTNGSTPPADPNATSTKTETQKKKRDYTLKKSVVLTHFIGSEKELHFTALTNIRTSKDSQTSDQAEVGYFLRSCKNRLNKSRSSQCLWRRTTPYIDDDVTKGGKETVLLENVNSFQLRYLGPEREEEWVRTWKSDQNGDSITQGKFPYAVEITITTQNKHIKNSKELSMTMVAPIRYPNNPGKKKEPTSGSTQAP